MEGFYREAWQSLGAHGCSLNTASQTGIIMALGSVDISSLVFLAPGVKDRHGNLISLG